MSKPKIYISSTFFDLQEHRAALAQALEKTECFDVVKMENYGTRSEKPAVKCMNDVADSEFYILSDHRLPTIDFPLSEFYILLRPHPLNLGRF